MSLFGRRRVNLRGTSSLEGKWILVTSFRKEATPALHGYSKETKGQKKGEKGLFLLWRKESSPRQRRKKKTKNPHKRKKENPILLLGAR